MMSDNMTTRIIGEKKLIAFGHEGILDEIITEDKNGYWDNSGLSYNDGYAVIHEGNKHYVYRLICGKEFKSKIDGKYHNCNKTYSKAHLDSGRCSSD